MSSAKVKDFFGLKEKVLLWNHS